MRNVNATSGPGARHRNRIDAPGGYPLEVTRR
jgi:hypothetical protein